MRNIISILILTVIISVSIYSNVNQIGFFEKELGVAFVDESYFNKENQNSFLTEEKELIKKSDNLFSILIGSVLINSLICLKLIYTLKK